MHNSPTPDISHICWYSPIQTPTAVRFLRNRRINCPALKPRPTLWQHVDALATTVGMMLAKMFLNFRQLNLLLLAFSWFCQLPSCLIIKYTGA